MSRYHPSVQAIMEGMHGDQQPVNENGDMIAAMRDEKKPKKDEPKKDEQVNESEVLIAEWADAVADGHAIVEGNIDGESYLFQVAEDILPDPIIQLSVNQFLLLSEDEDSYSLITVPISEGIGNAIMNGLRSAAKWLKGAWNGLADRLGGVFGKKDNRGMLKNYARMYRQDPEKLREIMHQQNLEANGGDEEKAKAATDKQLNQFSRFNAMREGSRRMAADFKQARENGSEPSADSMNYAKGVARAIATAKETAEREGISTAEAMGKVQNDRMGNVMVSMAANHPEASSSVRQAGQQVAQSDPEAVETGVRATGGQNNIQPQQAEEPAAQQAAEPAADPTAQAAMQDGTEQPAQPAQPAQAQGEAGATPAQAQEPEAPINPAPNAQQKKAMRQQAAPSRGNQNMQIAQKSRYTMTVKGNKQAGFNEQGQPQYESVTVKVPVNGFGLAAAIQNYMAGGTISAGAKHGHITPVQVQINDPKTGRKMTISTPRTAVKGQGQGQTGGANQRGNVQTQESDPFIQARARRTAATQQGAAQ